MQVIGLDIGNINTKIKVKDVLTSFTSRIHKCENANDYLNNDEIITINNTDYIVGSYGNYENSLEKYTKENYLLIFQYAIAKYSTEENVSVCLGLPISHFTDTDIDLLKGKILANKNFSVTINGESKNINIENLYVFPESFGIYNSIKKNNLIENNTPTLVIDIGGGTTDIAYIMVNGRYDTEKSKSIDTGLIDFYRLVSDLLYKNCGKLKLDIESTKEFCRGNENYIGADKKQISVARDKIFGNLLNELKGTYTNIKNLNIIVVGGGSRDFGSKLKSVYPQTVIIDDIFLNVNVFYNICKVKCNG